MRFEQGHDHDSIPWMTSPISKASG
jgi:hypothetical protein